MVEVLEWPESDKALKERDRFDARVMELLGDAFFVAFVPVPAPWASAAERVEAESGLERIVVPYNGLIWLCPVGLAHAALRPVFEARVPELAVGAFRMKPSAAEVYTALRASDGRPADRLLFFDEGDLVEIRPTASGLTL